MKGHFPPNDCGAPFSLRGNPELFVEISNSEQKIQLLWPWLEAGSSQIHGAVLMCSREASLGLPPLLGSSVVIVLLSWNLKHQVLAEAPLHAHGM